MTATRGHVPPTESSPNGGHPAAARRGAPAAAKRNLIKSAAQRADESATPRRGWSFADLGLRQASAAVRLAGKLAVSQQALLQLAPNVGLELMRIGLGTSQVEPEKGDKRFTDPAWQGNPLFRATKQTYLYLGSRVDDVVASLGLEGIAAERARFGLTLAREAMAPTNFFWTNPAAVKRCYDTGGRSVWRGTVNLARDMVGNHGLPSMVDRRPFELGGNIAASPGAVIHRSEVFELIQYTPQRDTVYARPLLVVPPQVNKYYALDLSPGRSMYEYLLRHGIAVFTISWRNPTGAQRDWDYDTYARAVIEAIDVIRQVSGAPDVNIMGGCLGGMTAAVAQAHLAARGDRRINSATMTVTMLDCDSDGRMFLFATPQTIALAKKVSLPRGVIEGWQLGSMFAWLRPNDLVWNYWVNNYLLGQDPPAFDILAWNADQTRLSSAFHRQMLDMVADNKLVRPGGITVLGTPIDLSRIDCDTYVVAGRTDHITPWQTCYRTTQLVSGRSQFVLCSSGHIQTVVADPKHRGLGYYLNPETPPEAGQWLAGAQRREGSWWEHWAGWLAERSGEQIPAPASLGSSRYPALEPAPGRYVRQ
jgi:polyhydroxyalkanoate synthase